MEVMEAKMAQAKAYLFLFGFPGGSKSAMVFWGWPETTALSSALSSAIFLETETETGELPRKMALKLQK